MVDGVPRKCAYPTFAVSISVSSTSSAWPIGREEGGDTNQKHGGGITGRCPHRLNTCDKHTPSMPLGRHRRFTRRESVLAGVTRDAA